MNTPLSELFSDKNEEDSDAHYRRLEHAMLYAFEGENCLELGMYITDHDSYTSRTALFIASEVGKRACPLFRQALSNLNHPHWQARCYLLDMAMSCFHCISYNDWSDIIRLAWDKETNVKIKLAELLSHLPDNIIEARRKALGESVDKSEMMLMDENVPIEVLRKAIASEEGPGAVFASARVIRNFREKGVRVEIEEAKGPIARNVLWHLTREAGQR